MACHLYSADLNPESMTTTADPTAGEKNNLIIFNKETAMRLKNNPDGRRRRDGDRTCRTRRAWLGRRRQDHLLAGAPRSSIRILSGGTKDIEASSLIVEPLARFDQTGAMVPYLAEEIPTVENGGVSEDLTSITWKLKEGLLWSDGTPVTSADVKFTAEYCMAPDGGCAQSAKFDGVASIDTPDERTIVVNFTGPKPVPYAAFVGAQSPIIQAAQFKDCLGAKAQECTSANFGPVGTGPFVVTDFKPNDVITMKANENFRDPAKPAFATLTFKGGGDAAAAGRAVMETGEYDYAWNLQLAPRRESPRWPKAARERRSPASARWSSASR